jgi:hypothetical protein
MMVREYPDGFHDLHHQQDIEKHDSNVAGIFRDICQSNFPEPGGKALNGIPDQLHYLVNHDQHGKNQQNA